MARPPQSGQDQQHTVLANDVAHHSLGADSPVRENDALPQSIDEHHGLMSRDEQMAAETGSRTSVDSWQFHVPPDVQQQLRAAGLRTDSVVFWIRPRSISLRDTKFQQSSQNVKQFVKFVSNRVSTAIERTNVMDTGRLLLLTEDGTICLVGQFALAVRVFNWSLNDFRIVVRMHDCELNVELFHAEKTADVEQISIGIDFSTPPNIPFGGSFGSLLGEWFALRKHPDNRKLLPVPLCFSASQPRRGHFLYPVRPSIAAWVSVSKTGFRLFNDDVDELFDFDRVISWREVRSGIEAYFWSEEGIRRIGITTNGTVPLPAATELPRLLKSQSPDNAQKADMFESGVSPEHASDTNEIGQPGHESLSDLKQCFIEHCSEQRNQNDLLVAEWIATSLFDDQTLSVGMTFVDGAGHAWVGDGPFNSRLNDAGGIWYEFPDGRYLQTKHGCFRLDISSDATELWSDMCQLTEGHVRIVESYFSLATIQSSVNDPAVPVTLNVSESGQVCLSRSVGDDEVFSLQSVSATSSSWATSYGQLHVNGPDDGVVRLLTASRQAISSLWKLREQQTLRASTSGVKLGQLYDEFSRRRMEKFLVGVFGSLVVAHEQLQSGGAIQEFQQELDLAPAGPLSEELNARLVQKLSILEISRQQIGRWFDRCSLYLPHFWASLEQDWMLATFGDQLTDKLQRDREALRVRNTIRGELRQLQASVGRPLQELGQNLNAVSFAFPEEVRCAALASVRNAASVAEKGAMMTVFGGMGAQLLLGAGRASVGDPIGIAILGAMGLSLFGRHLQKSAQSKEQQIRLRAYGIQALQWWQVIQESGVVMAFECRQTLEQLNRVSFDRDKSLLEKIPREQLPVVQKRMVTTMQDWLAADMQSQFDEVLPGTGMFGHHLVQQIAASTDAEARHLIKRFGSEVSVSTNKE